MPQQSSLTVPDGPAPRAVSLEGVGDVVDAGRRSGYIHLRQQRLPTIGRLVAAARNTASVLNRSSLRSGGHGRWQPAPRPARRHVNGRMRITVVTLEPNSFVAGPPRTGRPYSLEVLYPARGRTHLISSNSDGQMRSAAALAPDRARVVGASQGHHFLVNTGDEVAVVIRVTS